MVKTNTRIFSNCFVSWLTREKSSSPPGEVSQLDLNISMMYQHMTLACGSQCYNAVCCFLLGMNLLHAWWTIRLEECWEQTQQRSKLHQAQSNVEIIISFSASSSQTSLKVSLIIIYRELTHSLSSCPGASLSFLLHTCVSFFLSCLIKVSLLRSHKQSSTCVQPTKLRMLRWK